MSRQDKPQDAPQAAAGVDHERERRLERIFLEQIEDMVYFHGLDGSLSFVNQANERITGYPLEEIRADPMLWKRIVHPDDVAEGEWFFRELAGEVEYYETVYRLMRKDGDVRVIESRMYAVRDETGAIEGYCCIGRDVTERRELEEAERNVRRRYQALFSKAPVGIFRTTIDGRAVEANQAMAELVGCATPEEAVVHFTDLADQLYADPARREEFLALLRERGEVKNFEYEARPRDGVTRWFSMNARLDADPDGGLIEGFVTDITRRRAMERAVEKSEERLRLALSAVNDALWDWNRRTGDIYFSPRYYTMLGYEPGEFEASIEAWFEMLHPDDRRRMRIRLERLTNLGDFAGEVRLRAKDGSWRWIYGRGRAVEHDEAGRPLRMVGTNQDITERKEAEARLQASLAEKDVLLKEIHHRVKNNLQVISSLLSLQASRIEDQDTAAMFKQSRSRIGAMAMVHELLYETGDLSRVDFARYLQRIATKLETLYAEGESIRVELELELEQFDLSLDKAIPCGMIVNELLSNAFRHAFARRGKGRIAVAARARGGQVELRVADDGVGLPEAMRPESGRTLGLQLVHVLAGQLGAALEVSSGPGACFTLRFGDPGPG